ncbi:lytic transglycosylase domain-containing protein [Desulfobulbus marinus]|nr:lytic transglycosylase domain-containing protein [Desulfogranum marinum]
MADSNGDTQALSFKNARGLTQIIFTTGQETARAITRSQAIDLEQIEYVTRTQLEQLAPEDLNDSAVNIMLACYQISKYNKEYQGHLDLVVSAWNLGAGSNNNGHPPEYQETLNLIGKVNGLFRFFIQSRL